MSMVVCVKWGLLQEKQNSWVLLWLTICLSEHVVCIFPLSSANSTQIFPSMASASVSKYMKWMFRLWAQQGGSEHGLVRGSEWENGIWWILLCCGDWGKSVRKSRRGARECDWLWRRWTLYAREVMRNGWNGGWWKSSILVCMEHKIHGWMTYPKVLSKEVSCSVWCSFDVCEQDKSLWDFLLLLPANLLGREMRMAVERRVNIQSWECIYL